MNIIEIKITRANTMDDRIVRQVEIFIDNRSLINRLRKFELRYAIKEFAPSIAGAYDWLPSSPELRDRMLGSINDNLSYYQEKARLLECECGFPDCWPFLAKIRIHDEIVVWSEFEQPHTRWNYQAFGPFQFNRVLYESEVGKIE